MTELNESFTESTRYSDYWVKTGGNTWKIDGPNGLHINSSGTLALTGVLPDAMYNYTAEFEVAKSAGNKNFPALYLGIDKNGNYRNQIAFHNTDNSNGGILYRAAVHESQNGVKIGNVEEYKADEYFLVKIQVKDKHVDIYINGKYLATSELEVNNSAFVFAYHETNWAYKTDCYIRNFKITLG